MSYAISGGLPEPARWATVDGRFVIAVQDVTRFDFEARVWAMAAPRGLVIFGGIPPMPGVSTIMTRGQPVSAAATYWGDDDEQERPPPTV
jgi:hypothetical protein